jgi:hypothetical protein
VREIAVKAFKAMGCSGLSRVDFFVKKDGEIVLNEIITLPGFSQISMYRKLMGAIGVPYGELLDKLIGLAFERAGAGSGARRVTRPSDTLQRHAGVFAIFWIEFVGGVASIGTG